MNERHPPPLFAPLLTATVFRLILNTARRFAYPFAPVLSRGLGVSLSAITSLIALNQVTSLLGIFMGPVADRLGYRNLMIVGMGMLGVGMLAAAILPLYGTVLVALFLAGLGKSIFDPAIQAWVGNRIPFHRRAQAIGIVEISWSASTLVGIPLVALLIDHHGWRSPFLMMGILGGIGAVSLYCIFPKETDNHRQGLSLGVYLGAYRRLFANRPALSVLGYAFFISAANDNLFVVYGAWLEKDFGLSVVAVGLGTGLIGIAELLGEGATAVLADRWGLKRALWLGLTLSMASYFLLPLAVGSLVTALVGLTLVFLVYEFTVVCSLSLCTELLPAQRATMMAVFLASAGAGRVMGALLGGVVWQSGGILATGCLSGGLSGLGLACLLVGLRGWSGNAD